MENNEYLDYKQGCIHLLIDYTNCIENRKNKDSIPFHNILHHPTIAKSPFECYNQLYLIQKWCMNPVGNISKKT